MGFFFNGTNVRSRKARRTFHKIDQQYTVIKRSSMKKQKLSVNNNHRTKKNISDSHSLGEYASMIDVLNFENCFSNEIYLELICHLRLEDLVKLRLVNKRFYELINHLPHLYVSKLIINNVIHFETTENTTKDSDIEQENEIKSQNNIIKMLDINILNIPYINVDHFHNVDFDGFFSDDTGSGQYFERCKVQKLETLDFPNRYYTNNIQDENAFEMIKYLSGHKNLKFININRLVNNLIDICEWQSQNGIVDKLFETKFEFLLKNCSVGETSIHINEKPEASSADQNNRDSGSENQLDQDIHKGKLNDIVPILSSLKLGKYRIFEILLDLINDDFKIEIHDEVLKFAIHSKNEAMIDFLISSEKF